MPQDLSDRLICSKKGSCGSCAFADSTYAGTLAVKQEQVRRLLKDRVSSLENIVPCDEIFHYRNKIYIAFSSTRDGRISAGTFFRGSKRIVNTDGCLLEDERADAVKEEVKKLIRRYRILVYDARTSRGLLRGVLVRVGKNTGEMMVVVVVTDRMFPGKKNFIKELVRNVPDITTVLFDVNRRTDSMILDGTPTVEYGPGFIYEIICGMKFKVSASSFLQINTAQAEKLYSTAAAMSGIGKEDNVLDAYCGTGTIGITLSRYAKSVTGVEINKSAFEDAKANARGNKRDNIRFVLGDATEYMTGDGKDKDFNVIVLDPPRAGTTPAFIRACAKTGASGVVYISCEPKTLARDLELFAKEGFEAVRAIPFDMFPWTDSTECIVRLERKDGKEDEGI